MRKKNIGMWSLAVLFCGGMMYFVGCNRGNSAGATSEGATPQPTVGIVSMEQVARDLGWSDKQKSLEDTYRTQLKNQISGFATHYRAQLEDQQKAFAPGTEKLTPSQQQALQNMYGAMQQEMNQLENQANQAFQTYRLESGKRYREALLPIARQVATDRKMTVALMQTDMVLFADPSVDLSNAVVDSARSHPPILTEVPMTPLQAREIRLRDSTTQPATGATTRP